MHFSIIAWCCIISLPAIVFVAAHCHTAVLAAAHHHQAAHATHRLHVFLHGLHVLLHQLLAFLRVSCRPELIHLLLHFFHVLLQLGHLSIHAHAHRQLGGRGPFLRRYDRRRQGAGNDCGN